MSSKILARKRLELSILAMLARRSNRLRYGDLFITIDCSHWKDYLQPNCSAYNNKFKMASKIIGHREPRTLDPCNVNTTLYRLRYGDLFLTIDCSYSKDY